MKKIIKIKESDIRAIVKRVIGESHHYAETSIEDDMDEQEENIADTVRPEDNWSDLENVVNRIRDAGDTLDDIIKLATGVFQDTEESHEDFGNDEVNKISSSTY